MNKEDSNVMTNEEFGGLYLHEKLSKSNQIDSNPAEYRETFRDHVLMAGLQNSGIIDNGGSMNIDNNLNDSELNFDDIDFPSAGYRSNRQGVEAASNHEKVFRADTLQKHQQFWDVKTEEQQERRVEASDDRHFESDDTHTHRR